jgi:hypothetical protein
MFVYVRHERADTAPPPVVVPSFGEGLCLAQARQCQPGFTESAQHRPELEADVESLLERGLILGERFENAERLLESGPSLREHRSRGRL